MSEPLSLPANENRVAWVDYSKGICILLVVMMHSTLGYGELVHDTGWMHAGVAWAKPFRMPDFFMLAGLFLNLSIFGSKIDYLDRKVLHFAYFYILWLAIQTFVFEAGTLLHDPVTFFKIFLKALIIPESSLWFIHALAVFYIITWLIRFVPTYYTFAVAAGLQVLHSTGMIDTGWSVTNRFMEWYVFFFVGYAGSKYIFDFAKWAASNRRIAIGLVIGWAVVNTLFIALNIADLPGVSLLLGFAGALAIVTIGVFLTGQNWAEFLRHAGKYSIVIYLTFFLPMKILQKVLANSQIIPDVGLASLIVFIFASASPLIFHALIRHTHFNALYVRPGFARLKGAKRSV
ncbi:MAG: acyltransferase family protein [Hyphomonas sp.]